MRMRSKIIFTIATAMLNVVSLFPNAYAVGTPAIPESAEQKRVIIKNNRKGFQGTPEQIRSDVKEWLIKNGFVEVNGFNTNGVTPLLLAALLNKSDIVAYLIGKGASVNAKDGFGGTALQRAIHAHAYDSFVLLINAPDIDLSATDRVGHTPMDYAEESNDRRFLDELVWRGATK